MIGTTGATIVIVVKLLFACVLGMGAGGLTCLVLRLHWSLLHSLIDFVLTAVAAIATAYVVFLIDTPRNIWEPRDGLILAIAVGGVVLRHSIRLSLRSSRS
jgi:uncharacterized membrane protein